VVHFQSSSPADTPASTSATNRRSRARRRFLAASLTGAALFLVGAIFFATEYAGASGGSNPAAVMLEAPAASELTAPTFPATEAPRRFKFDRSFRSRSAAKRADRVAICVRLCDGAYFPSVIKSGGDEVCASQCPDAPTALYSLPAGSEDIEAAVSLGGAPYSALPVAHRFQLSFDDSCTCHRSLIRSYFADLLRDGTLRDGDLVMTPAGFTTYKGDKSGRVSAANFVPLSQSSTIAKSSRAELTAMEQAGTWDRQFGPYSYSSSAAETAATTSALPRRHRGTVTVDDGYPTR
jgi:hypothetical protein